MRSTRSFGKAGTQEKIELFLEGLQKQEDLVVGFDEDLRYSLIEYVTVFGKEDVRFTFKDGTEIKVEIPYSQCDRMGYFYRLKICKKMGLLH